MLKFQITISLMLVITLIEGEQKTLNIMGLFSVTGSNWPGGGACLTAAQMALRDVNAREDIFPDFKLNLTWRDGKCEPGTAVNMLYEMLYTKPTKLMMIGPGCSNELEVTAEASPSWNITHMTYGGASPVLSNRNRFPKLFRLHPQASLFNLARIGLAQYFNWKKVATLNVAMDYFSAITDDLVGDVKGTDIEIISQEIFDQDPLTRIQNLKKKDARIIFFAGYENHAKKVLCRAHEVGLYGPKVVWMWPGWYKDQFWLDPNTQVSCSDEQLTLVVEGSIVTGFFYKNFKIERGLANLTVPEFYDMYYQEESYRPDLVGFEFICPMCYDSIWAIALALQCANNTLQRMGHSKTIDEFEYSDGDIGDIMTSCSSNVAFLGISGLVKFEKSGDPMKNIRLDQIQDGEKVLVGIYYTEVEDWYFEWFNDGLRWKDGVPPRDSTLVSKVEVLISTQVYVVMSCLAALGIGLAVCLFVFNLNYRNNMYVKLSSTNINNVLLLGCIITYCTVFMESVEQHDVTHCKLRTFTFTIGFTMAFGALFSKTWRVYRIFSNKKLLRLKIKDFQLVGIVLGLLCVLCFVLLLWELLDPLYIVVRFLTKEVYLTGNDAEVRPFLRVCTSVYNTYFSWTICITEGVLLSFGAFLAFETRKVKIAALNDSRLIGMCLYNVVVLSAVGLTLNLALGDQVTLVYGIQSSILLIGTTSTQLVVFVPKIMAVFWPHRIGTDIVESLDGTRLGSTNFTIESKTKSLRPPCETSMSSELRPSYGIKSKDEAVPSPNDDTTKCDNGTESGC